jgi:hypothetical protein
MKQALCRYRGSNCRLQLLPNSNDWPFDQCAIISWPPYHRQKLSEFEDDAFRKGQYDTLVGLLEQRQLGPAQRLAVRKALAAELNPPTKAFRVVRVFRG